MLLTIISGIPLVDDDSIGSGRKNFENPHHHGFVGVLIQMFHR